MDQDSSVKFIDDYDAVKFIDDYKGVVFIDSYESVIIDLFGGKKAKGIGVMIIGSTNIVG